MLIRITQSDIDKGLVLQRKACPNSWYSYSNPISWAVSRMWNDKPQVDLLGPRVFVDCTLSYNPKSARSCIIEMPQEARDWFERFRKSEDVKPIKFVTTEPRKATNSWGFTWAE